MSSATTSCNKLFAPTKSMMVPSRTALETPATANPTRARTSRAKTSLENHSGPSTLTKDDSEPPADSAHRAAGVGVFPPPHPPPATPRQSRSHHRLRHRRRDRPPESRLPQKARSHRRPLLPRNRASQTCPSSSSTDAPVYPDAGRAGAHVNLSKQKASRNQTL